MNPIDLFTEWYNQELELSQVKIPSAVCLSTNGMDGFPNSRFVSFKDIVDNAFVVTGPIDSRKGKEIENNNKVALTFWWTHTERQVRIQGEAIRISDKLSDQYFSNRHFDSQVISLVCHQGEQVENLSLLEKEIESTSKNNDTINRPANWGGYFIKPIRIELMEFKETRFHDRKLFEFIEGKWIMKQIQP